MAVARAETSNERAVAASADDTAPPLDLAHLRRYTMGDAGLELEILGLFANHLPITIAALKNAASEKEWGMAAHTLKGSARAVGAWPLATIAESAERLRFPQDSAERGEVVHLLEEAADVARSYIAGLGQAA
jgi:HPt (histidine-containing phosphotransfer) domain-containing protein